jgi:ectoine hydroxylase-related dioxygenase (phytanoyl-CoA dioxygenase family)
MTRPLHRLSPRQADAYRRDGYLIVKGVFDAATIATMTAECDRLWATVSATRDNPRVQWRGRLEGGEVADRLDPVLDVSPPFDALAHDARLVEVAGDVLDGTAKVFKCKLITKRPGTLGYKMHQDYPYWEFLGVPADDFVNVLVAFDRFDPASGATEVFTGLHHGRIPPPPDAPHDTDESLVDASRGVLIELEPGDVALFHSMAPHRSAANLGAHDRRGLFLTYVPAKHEEIESRYERGRIDRAGGTR